MKLTAFILLAACIQVSATGYSQLVSVSFRNAPVEKVFKELQGQTGLNFIYTSSQVKNAKTITLNVKNELIGKVLDECFKDQPFTYTISDKYVVIKLIEPAGINAGDKKETAPPVDIKGRVLDEKGSPVIATISVKGTGKAISTNDRGEFEIKNVEGNAVLVISGVSIETFEVKVNGRSELGLLNAKLRVTFLDDVKVTVNTGYQQLSADRVTGSFTKPNHMVEDRVATDVISKLKGITSGLVFNVDPGSGQPYIQIRGRSTIFASAAPLIVVDNFPYEGDINNINPNDVEDITVLKDAAAASIWGVRAGNGVIVITSKRGRLNRPLSVQVNSNVTVGEKPDLFYDPNYLNSSDFIDLEKKFFDEGLYSTDIAAGDPADPFSSFPPLSPVVEILQNQQLGQISQAEADAQINLLRNKDVRNELSRHFYRNSINQQHAVSMSGGSNNATYFFSAGYDKNLWAEKGNEYERFTVSTLTTFSPVKRLKITGGINFVQGTNLFDNTLSQINTGGPLNKNIYPYADLADGNGNPVSIVKDYRYAFAENAPANGFRDWLFYPLAELNNKFNTSKSTSYEVRINVGVRYDILKNLNAEVTFQHRSNSSNSRVLAKQESYSTRNLINMFSIVNNGVASGSLVPLGDILTKVDYRQDWNYIRGQLNYSASFNQHAISAIAGVEQREVKTPTSANALYGYDDETATQQIVDYASFVPMYPSQNYSSVPYFTSEQERLDRFRSYFANAAYTYNGKYTVSGSVRADGSNFFGVATNQKIVPLWSVGAKWDIDKEKFYRISWLPSLHVRATYGYNGNLDKTVTAYLTVLYTSFAPYIGGIRNGFITNPPNKDLRWEKNRMLNLAIDFESLHGILSGSIEYFQKRGVDLMGDELFAPSVGFVNPLTGASSMRGNFAEMTGRGVDVSLRSKNSNKKIKWTTDFIFNYAKDEVTKFDIENPPATLVTRGNGESADLLSPIRGYPVYGVYSFRWGGLDPATGDPRGYVAGVLSDDYATLTNPLTKSDIVYNGPGRPTVSGGLTNQFEWKRIALSFNINYKFGYFFRRSSLSYSALFGSWIGNKDYSGRWQKTGDEAITNVPSVPANPSTSYNRDYFYRYSEVLVEKGDHIRLQDVSISYTLDKDVWKKSPFNFLQVYGYINNLGILWRANNQHLDPDVYSGYPSYRTVTFGIKLGL